MNFLARVRSSGLIYLAAASVMGLPAFAPAATVAIGEEFSSDTDAYGPTTRDPMNDPALDGAPPAGWNDVRNGFVGVVEENTSTAGDDPTYPGADPGAATPEYGILQPQGTMGPYASADYPVDSEIVFRFDHYADATVVSNGPSLDFWWTNAVGDSTGANYVTETGIAPDVLATGDYAYRTTSSVDIATVPAGSWYQVETIIKAGTDGDLDGIHNVWDATHSTLFGSVTLEHLAGNPSNQAIGPYYSWFTNFLPNVDALFIDDFNVVAVPEPSGLALLGIGATWLARRRRRA
jgi:hypothetical protein